MQRKNKRGVMAHAKRMSPVPLQRLNSGRILAPGRALGEKCTRDLERKTAAFFEAARERPKRPRSLAPPHPGGAPMVPRSANVGGR